MVEPSLSCLRSDSFSAILLARRSDAFCHSAAQTRSFSCTCPASTSCVYQDELCHHVTYNTKLPTKTTQTAAHTSAVNSNVAFLAGSSLATLIEHAQSRNGVAPSRTPCHRERENGGERAGAKARARARERGRERERESEGERRERGVCNIFHI